MVKRYQRRDEAGRNVDVEIWQDEKTCKITMLRVTTHFPDGEIKKFRSDFPNDGSPEFERAIQREIAELKIHMGILATLEYELNQKK